MANAEKRRRTTKHSPESAPVLENGNAENPTFGEGAIIRIMLKHFMTYDSVEFRAGPQLNIVIGANGAGKSAIMVAICLGLAGKTSVLGRARQPTDFIKSGCESATIELELHNEDGDNYIIRRDIHRNNTSQWTVNDRAANQRTIEEKMKKLNIQVGNLCQFLPQDRVADFARMSQQELLENTEKAVSPAVLYEPHQRLKVSRESSQTQVAAAGRMRETLTRETATNARLHDEVRAYEARRTHLERVKVLGMKRTWMVYKTKRVELESLKERRKAVAAEVVEVRQRVAPLTRRLDAAREHVRTLELKERRAREEIRENTRNAVAQVKLIDDETTRVGELHDDLAARQTEDARRHTQLSDLRDQLTLMRDEFTNLAQQQDDLQPQIDDVMVKMRTACEDISKVHQHEATLRQELSHLTQEIISLKMTLRRVQDVGNRRLELLRSRHRHAYDAVLWLRANSHRLKATIHEPMMLIINMRDSRHAKFIEMHVSNNDMRAFVCENDEDMEFFLRTMRDEQHLRVNAVRMPDRQLDSFRPSQPIERLRKYGFSHYLRDMFDCPDAVMRYLCVMYHVYNTPVGSAETKNLVKRVIRENPQMTMFYTESHQYVIKKSRYGANHISSKCTELKSPQLLSDTLDMARKQDLEQQLQGKQTGVEKMEETHRTLQLQSRTLEATMETLRTEKTRLIKSKTMRSTLTQKILLKEQSIKRLDFQALDMVAEERIIDMKIRKSNGQKCSILVEYHRQIKCCHLLGIEKVRLGMQHVCAAHTANQMEIEIGEQGQAVEVVEERMRQIREKFHEVRDEAHRLNVVYRTATNTPGEQDLPAELVQVFNADQSTTIQQIDDAIHQEQVRADLTVETDERVVAEYETRKTEIARLTDQLEGCESRMAAHRDEADALRLAWRKPLDSLIDNINANFGRLFASMNCAGEVDLSVPDDPSDFGKYGVRIRVKYRAREQLRELTPHHQSGGERSVATILFMVALQTLKHLAPSPFRCVDEINQGMDPRNERKIFDLICQTAQNNGKSSQFFMVTPKLLPDLEYSDNVTVLCVYNGVHMTTHSKWNVNRFLQRRAKYDD